MKLRYYMRGLGIGIVVTAIIMGISLGGKKETLTDAQIKERASKLGMIESTVLTEDTQKVSEDDSAKEPDSGETTAEEPREPETQEPETQESGETDLDTIDVPLQTENTEVSPQEPVLTAVKIEVKRGDSSVSVSKRIAEAGLVADAAEFDTFLCQNGYDKSICVGSYEIPSDATEEEIAKIITKK